MASYVESNLIKGEKLVYKAEITFWILLYPIALLVIYYWKFNGFLNDPDFGSPVIATIIQAFLYLFLISKLIEMLTTELALTNKKVIAKYGLIRRNTIEINLSKIESVYVNQGFIGRFLGYGNVTIKGSGGSANPIKYISKPMDFRKAVNEALPDNKE